MVVFHIILDSRGAEGSVGYQNVRSPWQLLQKGLQTVPFSLIILKGLCKNSAETEQRTSDVWLISCCKARYSTLRATREPYGETQHLCLAATWQALYKLISPLPAAIVSEPHPVSKGSKLSDKVDADTG